VRTRSDADETVQRYSIGSIISGEKKNRGRKEVRPTGIQVPHANQKSISERGGKFRVRKQGRETSLKVLKTSAYTTQLANKIIKSVGGTPKEGGASGNYFYFLLGKSGPQRPDRLDKLLMKRAAKLG